MFVAGSEGIQLFQDIGVSLCRIDEKLPILFHHVIRISTLDSRRINFSGEQFESFYLLTLVCRSRIKMPIDCAKWKHVLPTLLGMLLAAFGSGSILKPQCEF